MTKVRVTKEFGFEMAHALWNYDGPCRNVHGHSYRLYVTVIGEPINSQTDPKHGMVIDFGDLKKIVKTTIINKFDHSVVVSKEAPHHLLQNIEQMFEKYDVMDYQPTCENLVVYFAGRLMEKLPENLKLFSLRLVETAKSYAEWYAEDN
ncbi:MAG: 6-carboxytetrahydropterin synthase QueD [Bacteroidetes bacterium]|nr:6-carboxytetrahydropterin synthase QueD [Bacteroidota bacterium]